MNVLAVILFLSTWTGGDGVLGPGAPADVGESALEPDSDLPLRLEDPLPRQQGLDGAPVEKTPAKQDEFGRTPRRDDDLNFSVGAHARFTVPFGAADRSYATYYGGYYVVDHYLSWADFFNPGWGYEMEVDIFLSGDGRGRRTPGFNYGLTLLYQTDLYYGTKSSDGFGHTLSLDDMTTNSLQIGGRVVQTTSSDFYYGGVIALGAIHYSEVEGTISGVGFTTFRDKVWRDTWTIASTFRADGGYRLGPVGIVVGAGLRIMGPPAEGTHWSFNSGAFWSFDVDLGVEIGF